MRVTIGIPVYNCERWISQTVETALAQSWPDKEVIVVDDGSTDRTVELCRAFGDRIRLVSQGRQGGNVARNAILRAAQGEWIQFLDADDALPPTKVADQLGAAAAAEADVLCTPVLFETWADGRVASQARQNLAEPVDWRAEWLRWNLPQTGGCLWRAAALRRIGGWDEQLACNQEYELYFRALRAGLAFALVPAAPAVYRLWSEGTVCRKDPGAVVAGKTTLIQAFLRWLDETGVGPAPYRRLAGMACFEMARTLARQDLGRARAYYAERRREGLLAVAGPAAPPKYRLTMALLGFAAAERLADWQRRTVAAP